ncbi:membrane dipeptidase [Prevotella sp. kh1p2]|uniref:membrane dipeptidase n=1 Tax=Prevotella sp. kh1p2 TaxID=1761883 RepID=UPI0008D3121D|nr:membrane dipeptidase [Prevotella sp. kh1p2]SES71436.1 Gamma-glutamyl-gamma-aminobutyrate hydrolase PuuD (putrescine degradation), contains GATase1-like domain [Prevotella sp. kh1p2]SNU10420.1 Gamma-glutamyl-gamma-aminobutyrate hydrolase PuuD (putrescine degradation), contains GATase1-like domain [Prevotellaceae bacterium KH2P17]
MNDFDLQSHLDSVYATFPEASNRPVIGITSNYTNGDAALRDRYYTQVVAAGGTPVIIPPVADKDVIIGTLDRIDGLLLTGGGDYNPLWAGEEPLPQLHGINSERDLPELLLTRLAFNRQIPMLGICRGIQTLALALGGTLMQDIAQGMPAAARLLKHSQDADRQEPTHSVSIEPDSILHGIYGAERLYVNSFHHQAVQDPGKRFRVTAQAPDGVTEAIESTEFKAVLGVQWHPEWLQQEGLKLFEWLVGEAGNFSVAKRLHHRVLTLDTHCDTPMFFPQGVNFAQRDPRILVDLHKMADGRQDAVTMVAYLPQPKPGEPFAEKIDIAGLQKYNPQQAELLSHITPTAYADFIFDKIEATVHEHAASVAIARTPAQLYENKRHGRKSVMLGIENGLALGSDLSNISHFAQRGVVYITLCHNGDNQICDSARGSGTHGGVSAFGEQVIREMNAQGIMVDLSHGAERSFYDALDISQLPIVCSHSNCRALCNVPRNLTDQQLRALALKGGVAHTTLYAGFLRQAGEADIRDAVAHLEHAISVMGIEHVGLGTDFDGDGGIRGLADSSELINFTICLLRRKYSEQDIARIWGGNWLRVMTQVQNARK